MIQVRLPSGRMVPVDTDDPKVAAATARAFVQRDPYESTHAAALKHPGLAAASGALQTAYREVPFLSELQAGAFTPLDMASDALHGRPVDAGRSFAKERAQQQGLVDSFQSGHPIASSAVKGVTMAAPVAAAILSGGATAAPTVAEEAAPVAKGVSGFLQSTVKPMAMRTARRATAGAATGAVYGAAQPGSVSDRLQSAQTGGELGAVVGAAAPPVIEAAGRAAGKVASSVGKTSARAANKVVGGALLDTNQVAAQRLTAALKADGATPQLVRDAMNSFLKNGATDPSLIDVASRLPSGGQNTLALVRGAAAKGSGRNVAAQYAGQIGADLQDKAIARTRALTADTRPASVVRAEAVAERENKAEQEYAAPYAQPVDAAPVISALDGSAGRKAISGAYQGADARRLTDQMGELDKLRQAAGPEEPVTASVAGQELPMSPALADRIKAAVGSPDDTIPVSLGTLHRLKVALEEGGRAAAKADTKSVAGGLFDRASEIDDHLAAHSPEYAEARDNYATRSAGIDALDHGATGLMASPDEYEAALNDLRARGGVDAAANADIGYRGALTDALGAPAENAKGPINKISTSTNQKRNLAATFGDEPADSYRAGLTDLAHQARNADSINPNTGSPTAMRLADMGLVEPSDVAMPRVSGLSIVLHAVNKIRAGATLTDAEREAITRVGTTMADPGSLDLGEHLRLPPSEALDRLRAVTAALGADQNRRDSQ